MQKVLPLHTTSRKPSEEEALRQDRIQMQYDKNPSYDPEDKFECRLCQKGYRHQKSLLTHIRNVDHKSKK